MTEIAEMESVQAENAALRAALEAAQATIVALGTAVETAQASIATLEAQVRALAARGPERPRPPHSQNSSAPPSRDQPGQAPRNLRRKSGKAAGGQLEHPGAHLEMQAAPDAVQVQRPAVCVGCAAPLEGVPVAGRERRESTKNSGVSGGYS